MTTVEEVRTDVIALFRTAWLANGTSAPVPIVYDNDANSAKPEGEDADGRALPWCRISIRNLSEDQDTLGAPGARRFLNEGLITVEIYTASGDGYTLGGVLARVAKLAFRGNSLASGAWFTQVTSTEKGLDGPWSRIDVTARVKSEDIG
jgi:hypothetical protein